ncbi:hypothetical protein GCM10008018_22870 [Paenibacillus marchantiophytorum]|uniref:Uncharacterized protein n=1 Tax=Paenibacillus marchantiophytorum TaxID=1619310 RepID=A0ABQ1ELK5_9BACL|nr:hypothetical protein [Paenibacillus marchantiophytorum]GFZ76837.1 hypothetical protein GCM10008018_22870 [Paenibacillus marchantiophytorum]
MSTSLVQVQKRMLISLAKVIKEAELEIKEGDFLQVEVLELFTPVDIIKRTAE